MQSNFSHNLKAIREQAGIKIKHISDETGLCRETIYDYESGKRVPTLTSLVKIAKFFGVSLDQLVFG